MHHTAAARAAGLVALCGPILLTGCGRQGDLPTSFDTDGTVVWEEHGATGDIDVTVQAPSPVRADRIYVACTSSEDPGDVVVTTPLGAAQVTCPDADRSGWIGHEVADASSVLPAGDFRVQVDAPAGVRWSVAVTSAASNDLG